MQSTEVFMIAIVSSLATCFALHVVGTGIVAYMNSPPPPPVKYQALDDAEQMLNTLLVWNVKECNVMIGIGGRSEAAFAVLEQSFQSVRYMECTGGSIGCYSGVMACSHNKEKHVAIFVDAGTQCSDVDTAREKVREWGGTVACVFAFT